MEVPVGRPVGCAPVVTRAGASYSLGCLASGHQRRAGLHPEAEKAAPSWIRDALSVPAPADNDTKEVKVLSLPFGNATSCEGMGREPGESQGHRGTGMGVTMPQRAFMGPVRVS